jgi:hypothetical protein
MKTEKVSIHADLAEKSVPKVHQKHTRNTPKIHQKYTKTTPFLHQRYTLFTPEVQLPDEYSLETAKRHCTSYGLK